MEAEEGRGRHLIMALGQCRCCTLVTNIRMWTQREQREQNLIDICFDTAKGRIYFGIIAFVKMQVYDNMIGLLVAIVIHRLEFCLGKMI
jgi:hypothetical protein